MEDWFIIVNYGKVIIRIAMESLTLSNTREQIENIWLYANGCTEVLDSIETTQNKVPCDTETDETVITDLGDNTDPQTSRVYEEGIGWNSSTEEKNMSQTIPFVDSSIDAEYEISSEEDLNQKYMYHETKEPVSYKDDLNTQRHHESLESILSEYLNVKQTDKEPLEPISPERRLNQQQSNESNGPKSFEDDLNTQTYNDSLELTSSADLSSQNYHESLELILSTSEGTCACKPSKLVTVSLLDHISIACTTVSAEQDENGRRPEREDSVTGSDEILGDCDGDATEQDLGNITSKGDGDKIEPVPAAIGDKCKSKHTELATTAIVNKCDGDDTEPVPAAIAGKCDGRKTEPTKDGIAGKCNTYKTEPVPDNFTGKGDRATPESTPAEITVNSDRAIKNAHDVIGVNCNGEATEHAYADIADKFDGGKNDPVSEEIVSKCGEKSTEAVSDAFVRKCDGKKTEPTQDLIAGKLNGVQIEPSPNEIVGSDDREGTEPATTETGGKCDGEKRESNPRKIASKSSGEKAEIVPDDNHFDEIPDEPKSNWGTDISVNDDEGQQIVSTKTISYQSRSNVPQEDKSRPKRSETVNGTCCHSDAQIGVRTQGVYEAEQQFSDFPGETFLDPTTDCEPPPGSNDRVRVDNSPHNDAEHNHATNTFKSDSSTVYVHLLGDARQNLQYGDHNECFCEGQLNYADIQISKTMNYTTGHQGKLLTADIRRKKTIPTVMRLHINKGIVQIGNGRQNPKIQCHDSTYKDCEHHRRYYCDCTTIRGMQIMTLESPEIHLYVTDQITVQCGKKNTSFTIDPEYLEHRTIEEVQTVARQFKALQTVTTGQVCVKVRLKPSASFLSRIHDRAFPCLTYSNPERRMDEDRSDRYPGSGENVILGATEPVDFEHFKDTQEYQICRSRSKFCRGLILAENHVSGYLSSEPIGGESDLECDITPVFDDFYYVNGTSVMCERSLEMETLKDVEMMTESGDETRQVHYDHTSRQTRNVSQRKASWEEDETSCTQCEHISNTQVANLQRYFADSRCSCMYRWTACCLFDKHAVQNLVEDRLATPGFSQTLSWPSLRCVHETFDGSYIFTLEDVEIDETLPMKTFVEDKLFQRLYGLEVYDGVYVQESTDVDIEITICRLV